MIQRELEPLILSFFSSGSPTGLILAGIVGCGKTTLIKSCLAKLNTNHRIYEFSGDDTVFRNQVQQDSKYIYQLIRGQTQEKVLVFIDEVQKCEEVFDALKVLFDKGNASFIVSGSNPAFLQSIARKRLQRRADFKVLQPLGLVEIFSDAKTNAAYQIFSQLLQGQLPNELPSLEYTPKMSAIVKKYLQVGGLPLAFLDANRFSALIEIQKTFDRGFEPIRTDSHNLSDTVAIELAKLHAREFTYSTIMKQARISQRQTINQIIQDLINHGYLGIVAPYLFDDTKRSYLKKYFYFDPGLVSYLTGYLEIEQDLGYRIEGLVYSRLSYHLQFSLTKNKGIYFYKNYTISADGSLRFSKGEVDAVYQSGPTIIPIEIKTSTNWKNINTSALEQLLKEKRLPFGLVFYGGVPMRQKNIVFWPYWLI